MSSLIRWGGVFYRRRIWFFIPFTASLILSLVVVVLLTQFYNSPLFPRGVKEWLEAENLQTLSRSLEKIKGQLDQQKADINQFQRMNKNELASHLSAYLRALGQMHVDLHEIKRSLKGQERANDQEQQQVEQLVDVWLSKKSTLQDMQKKYHSNHPKIMAIKKEMQIVVRKIAFLGSRLEDTPEPSELSRDALMEKETQLAEQIRLYERRIEAIPDREKALAVLTARYNETQQAYQTLLLEKPLYIPDSVRMGLFGSLAGFVIGLLLVIFREKMDRSLHTDFELGQILPIPVLATIYDAKAVPLEGKAQPSATWSPGPGGSLYGQRTLFLVKDR